MLFDERYLIPASPFLYVLVSAVVWEILLLIRNKAAPRGLVNVGWAACAIYCVLLALSLYHYYFNPRFGKEQWREADAHINSLVSPGENAMIVFDPDYLLPCYRYYTTRNLPRWQVTPQIEAKLETSGTLVEEHTRDFQRILLVRSHDNEDTVLNAGRRAFTQESYLKFSKANPIEVYSFRASEK
jgi:hypothetical protein